MPLASIKDSLESALALAGYKSSVPFSQVEHDLIAIVNGLSAAKPSLQSIPTTNASIVDMFAIVPRGINVTVSVYRASSSLQNLSAPLTPEEGSTLLAIFQNIQQVLLDILEVHRTKAAAINDAVFGLSAWGLPTFQSWMDVLIQAFAVAAPANISRDAILEIQTSIDSAIQSQVSA